MPIVRPNAGAATAVSNEAKKLKVQVGVCKRLNKEVESYIKEVTVNEGRVQKMRDEGRDEYDIRKQEEVLQESYMMVPDSKRRFEAAVVTLNDNLKDYLASLAEGTQPDAALVTEAKDLLDKFLPQEAQN